MRRIFCTLLSLILFASSAVGNPPAAKPESKVDKFIRLSHELAKSNAEQVLNSWLLGEVQSLMTLHGLTTQAQQSTEHLEKLMVEGAALHHQLDRISNLGPEVIGKLHLESLENLYSTFRRSTQDLNLLAVQMDETLLALSEIKAVFPRISQDLVNQFDHLCAAGMAIDPKSEVLPVVLPIPSFYSFQYTHTLKGESSPDNQLQNGINSPELFDTPEKQAMGAVTTAGIYIAALRYLTGKWVLAGASSAATGAAGAATTTTASVSSAHLATAAAATAVIVAVVVLAIVAVNHINHVKKSAKAVKNGARAFHGHADLEGGRKYFIQACKQAQAVLTNLPERLLRLEAQDPSEITRLDEIEPERWVLLGEFIKAQAQYEEKYQSLREMFPKEDTLSDEDKKVLSAQIVETEEYKQFEKINEKLTPKYFAEVIEVLVLRKFKNTVDEIRSAEGINLANLRVEEVEMAEKKLWRILKNEKTRQVMLATNSHWLREIEENEAIAKLYRELDAIVLQHSKLVVDEILTRRTSKNRKELEARKTRWTSQLTKLKQRYQNSDLLTQLYHSFESLGD